MLTGQWQRRIRKSRMFADRERVGRKRALASADEILQKTQSTFASFGMTTHANVIAEAREQLQAFGYKKLAPRRSR